MDYSPVQVCGLWRVERCLSRVSDDSVASAPDRQTRGGL